MFLTQLIVVILDVLIQLELIHLFHLECLSVKHSHVFFLVEQLQEVHQTQELTVVFVVFEGSNRDAIGQLSPKRVHRIVHNDHVLHVPVFEHSQVLYVHVIRGLNAMVSIQSVLYQLLSRVNVVQDNICIPFMTGCKHHYLKVLIYHFKTLLGVGTDVKAGCQHFPGLESDVKVHLGWVRRQFVSDIMGQGFVQIKDYCFFNTWLREWQFDHSGLDLREVYRVQVLKETYRLEYVDREFTKHWSLQL